MFPLPSRHERVWHWSELDGATMVPTVIPVGKAGGAVVDFHFNIVKNHLRLETYWHTVQHTDVREQVLTEFSYNHMCLPMIRDVM